MTIPSDARIRELCDSAAFNAGVDHEPRRIAELHLLRASLLEQMPGPTPRAVVRELRRIAQQLYGGA